MNLGLYLAFIGATVLLILIPGPTAMLVTSISMRRGLRSGLTAVGGSSTAVVIQLTAIVAGLASLVALAGRWFEWIRWLGVAYLIFLGLRAWLGKAAAPTPIRQASSAAQDFGQGFVVTLTNPKTLLFLGAFLPQFIDPSLPALRQLLILAASFLIISAALDGCWALLASTIGTRLKLSRFVRLRDRVTGAILIAAGATLALARRP